ncbi:MAG: peptidoglycan D,D-transpeptidase FtsI family protein [Acidimicrobiales bacterium]
MNRSIRAFGLFVMALFIALVLQLTNLQVVQADRFNHDQRNTRAAVADFSRPRGAVQTADGVVLAESVPSKDQFKYQRVYRQGLLYAFVTGFLSFRYGATGVEQSYADQLAGRNLPVKASDLTHLFDNSGQRTASVTLTLTAKLQQAAASALGDRVGAVVALDPRDGSVQALVSQPTYDPNQLASHDPAAEQRAFAGLTADPGRPMLPRVYRQSYAPGSTFKTVTTGAVLDHRPDLATKAYPVTNALKLPLTTNQLHNFGGESCGGTLPELFRISCDTGFGQIGLDLGPSVLSDEATGFGFDKTPPLDLPGVFKSTFPPASFFSGRTPLLAFSAIGQDDVSATPLQMALVAAGVANHGVVMAPHVMKEVRDSDGALVTTYRPTPWLTATTATAADQIRDFMVSVVTGGTGTAVALPGVKVAAKTGTAEVDATHTNAWMIAFAPADNPTIAVAAVLPGLTGVGNEVTGGVRAAPIVRAVLAAYLGVGQ